jgi:hypothetical protein
MRTIVVDRANCHVLLSPATHNLTVIIKGKSHYPLQDIVHLTYTTGCYPPITCIDLTKNNVNDITGFYPGEKFEVTAFPHKDQLGPCFAGHCAWTYEQTLIFSPAYSYGKPPCASGYRAVCSGTMPSSGEVSVEFDVYHRCNNPVC